MIVLRFEDPDNNVNLNHPPMNKTKTPKTTAPILHVDEKLSLEEQIARRAHELWHQRGHEHGNDLTHWLQAEREINEWHQRRLKQD